MAQNESVRVTLVAQPVPADRECVRNLSDILEGAVDYLTLDLLASAAGASIPATNSTAQQALTTANEALQVANTVNAKVLEKRSSGQRVPLAAGDSVGPITWTPPMPSTNYEVRITLWGDAVAMGSSNQPGWQVVIGSETSSSVNVNFGNIKAGMAFTWVVEALS